MRHADTGRFGAQSSSKVAKTVIGREISSRAAATGLARTMRNIDVKLDAAHRRADKLLADIKAMNAK